MSEAGDRVTRDMNYFELSKMQSELEMMVEGLRRMRGEIVLDIKDDFERTGNLSDYASQILRHWDQTKT